MKQLIQARHDERVRYFWIAHNVATRELLVLMSIAKLVVVFPGTCPLSLLNSDKGREARYMERKCRPSPEQTNGPDNHEDYIPIRLA
jgi:hypothetical protein